MVEEWRIVVGLLAFIGVLLIARSLERPRMSDRPWMRQFMERK